MLRTEERNRRTKSLLVANVEKGIGEVGSKSDAVCCYMEEIKV